MIRSGIIFCFWLFFFGDLLAAKTYLPTSSSKVVIHHQYYSLSYLPTHKLSEWTYHELTAEMANGKVPRKNQFRADPKLALYPRAFADDYMRSGYDRGHMVPAGDMKITTLAMSESFFMSNIYPQTPSLNRGIWVNLENLVRKWAKKYDQLYIVTGGIYRQPYRWLDSEIAIPDYCYKIILLKDLSDQFKMAAFMMPNDFHGFSELADYEITVDQLELLTGLDFFSQLPDSLEQELESQMIYNEL